MLRGRNTDDEDQPGPAMMLAGLELKVTGYDRSEGVATVTLDRPPLNTWTGRMHHEYRACLVEAERDPAVRAIVVTGAGHSFCAGADARALTSQVDKSGYDPGVVVADLPRPGYGLATVFDAPFAYHFGVLKPIVAAINGAAAGVGLVLACFCDVRLAAAGAKLTVATPRLGLPAEFGLSWVLPRIVGTGRAADLLLTSRVVLAEEAERMGLVNRVVAADDLTAEARDYAHQLATSVSPAAVREIKRQLYADLHRDVGAAVRDAEDSTNRLMRGPDFAEGVAAWRGRRPPRFTGD